VAAARNRAIEASRGELVAPLDADDLWDPTKIERQVRRLLESGDGTGLVYCWWVSINGDGLLLDSSPQWRFEGQCWDTLLQVNFIGSASVPLYRRRDLVEVGGYDVTLREQDAEGCEDLDLALKVAERFQVAVVPSCLVGYRRRRGNMSSRRDRMLRSHALVIENVRKRRPALSRVSIRRSRHQFALYLAGVAYRSGAYRDALYWGWPAWRSALALQVLPSIVKMCLTTAFRRDRSDTRIIAAGVRFSTWELPQALIPYDRIYLHRFKHRRSSDE
jgi:glycosyltransferase involved in cell wall biosynthesis